MSSQQPDLPQLQDDTGSPVTTDDFNGVSPTPGLQQQLAQVPREASDVDVIEKEWVNHLKHVVAQTAENPYKQQAEISKIKADYMKKRYNKDVKLSES